MESRLVELSFGLPDLQSQYNYPLAIKEPKKPEPRTWFPGNQALRGGSDANTKTLDTPLNLSAPEQSLPQ
jgi:hypothetical protein